MYRHSEAAHNTARAGGWLLAAAHWQRRRTGSIRGALAWNAYTLPQDGLSVCSATLLHATCFDTWCTVVESCAAPH